MGIGLRTFTHPLVHRLGSLCILGTSFLVGYFLTGRWQVGAICAGSWLLMPWLEILLRVRQLRMPAKNTLRHRRAPSRELFPALEILTEQMEEEEGFEQVDDAGWDWQDHQHFLRLFYKPDERLQAAICMVEQEGMAFYYVSFFSRAEGGKTWVTWNYPFSYSMKMAPDMKINRMGGTATLFEMLASHRDFLGAAGVPAETLRPSEPEEIASDIQCDMEGQIAHNVKEGLLLPDVEGMVRYSWRGCFYIWFQFLREFVRFT